MTLFDLADRRGLRIPSSCGRNGTCHECIVEVRPPLDALSPPTPAESFLKGSYRLACQAHTSSPGLDFSPLARKPKILTESSAAGVELDPCLRRHSGHVYYEEEWIDEYRGHLYGAAMDLGTTTIVLEIVDLESGFVVYQSSFENPQRFGGSDVMHRISYDAGPFRGELHAAVIAALNRELKEACRTLAIARHEIYELVIVGNSTMRDLFFGLDVQPIGQRPYKSITELEFRAGSRPSTTLTEPAHKLGLWMHPKARVIGAPLISSHVGADTAADLAAIDAESHDGLFMLIDIGTNTEVVLGRAGRLLAASCPAGPAFEGGHVKFGMPGVEGAIESLRLVDGQWQYRVIGSAAPEGICGSGLIDLLAELRRHGQMTPMGVFPGRARELTIVPERGITLSRDDASNLAQAKAANVCGQQILLRHFGVRPRDIDRLYLAGGFANYIDVPNAIEIGFLAPVPENRIVRIGNASVAGARRLLCSRRRRRSIEAIAPTIEHIELETTPDFFDIFVEGCQFKPMPE